jgi:hypothetical protein
MRGCLNDPKYRRICAAYRLLSRGRIDAARAAEIIAQRHTETEMKPLRNLVSIWTRHLASAA